jgi:hypothetical protein
MPQKSTDLMAQLRNSSSWRSFVLSSWAAPSEGGRFYASKLVDFCNASLAALRTSGAIAPSLSSNDPQYHNALKWISLIQSQCSQFSEEELTSFSRSSLLASGDGDPLLRQSVSLGARPSRETKVSALREVFDRADPNVLDELGIRLSLVTHNGSAAIYFDGAYFPIASDPPIVAAYYLVACEFGMPCADDDSTLGLGCITGGMCYGSRLHRVQIEMAKNDTARLGQIIVYRDAIVAAIRAGDVSKFVPR